ncbi:MAG: c-type cytochrome domain-containing protein [Pirellulales bacterium]
MPRYILTTALFVCVLSASVAFAQPDEQLAESAYGILNKYCHACHLEDGGAPQFDLLNPAVLLDEERKPRLIVPGDPEASNIWQMVGDYNAMPPDGSPQPTDEEKLLLRTWIEQGAPVFKPGAGREPLTEQMVLEAISADLNKINFKDRPRIRYFSLANLYNNELIADFNLRLYRAALSKAINSMSRERRIAVIVPLPGTWKSIYRLDMREVGWDKDPQLWFNVLNAYPYGMSWNDPKLANLQQNIKQLYQAGGGIGAGVEYIRADWFVTKATRGSIYEALLNLPATIDELEQSLGVDIKQDFLNDQMARAGFATSGVSRHNRAVDRFRGGPSTAYYYRSWDFGKSFGRGVLYRFPLGPTSMAGDAFPEHAFEADGGEVVYSLPNGMQGYYICDNVGKKLDPAPVSIVRDLSEIAGSPAVENGISCMGCHKRGVQSYTDSIRGSFLSGGSAVIDKVERIYPTADALKGLIDNDVAIFMNALDRTISPFLNDGAEEPKSIEQLANLPEPITALARLYQSEIGLEEIARELGLAPSELAITIRRNDRLLQLGLGPIAANGKIVREMWDTREDTGTSVYQEAGLELGMCVPKSFNAAAPKKAAAAPAKKAAVK